MLQDYISSMRMLSVLSGNLEDEGFFFFEIMYMIKYVLLTLGPPAERDVLQKRRRLIFQYLGTGSSVC